MIRDKEYLISAFRQAQHIRQVSDLLSYRKLREVLRHVHEDGEWYFIDQRSHGRRVRGFILPPEDARQFISEAVQSRVMPVRRLASGGVIEWMNFVERTGEVLFITRKGPKNGKRETEAALLNSDLVFDAFPEFEKDFSEADTGTHFPGHHTGLR